MKTLVFTICARNYIGLASVLGRSVYQHGVGVDFSIFVAEGTADAGTDGRVLSAPEALAPYIDPVEYRNMALAYNVTEFCTALKAACFMHAFDNGYDRCIYMDPDVLVTSGLDQIVDQLERTSILITPHLCVPSLTDGPRSDRGILATGVYNLGFIALRRSDVSLAFVSWWHERLRRQAFNDHYTGLYTDQRWIDFVPCLFPDQHVQVWRHLGCNVAPWNYHERRIEQDERGYVVTARADPVERGSGDRLIFLHFSGFDFRKILDGEFDQVNLADAGTFPDLIPLYELYGDAIRSQADVMARHLALPYGFDRYEDGSVVLPSHRRLFRVWRERHGDAAEPFSVGAKSFHAALRSKGLLAVSDSDDLIQDKANSRTVPNSGQLLSRAQVIFRLLFRVVGRARFFFLVRSLTRLSHTEQHYDTFRLDLAEVDRADMSKSRATC